MRARAGLRPDRRRAQSCASVRPACAVRRPERDLDLNAGVRTRVDASRLARGDPRPVGAGGAPLRRRRRAVRRARRARRHRDVVDRARTDAPRAWRPGRRRPSELGARRKPGDLRRARPSRHRGPREIDRSRSSLAGAPRTLVAVRPTRIRRRSFGARAGTGPFATAKRSPGCRTARGCATWPTSCPRRAARATSSSCSERRTPARRPPSRRPPSAATSSRRPAASRRQSSIPGPRPSSGGGSSTWRKTSRSRGPETISSGRCGIEAEIDAITHELASAAGLGGRDRRLPSPAERARVSVTKAIRGAVRAVAADCPELGRHLDASVRTGRLCSYAPPGEAAPAWRR